MMYVKKNILPTITNIIDKDFRSWFLWCVICLSSSHLKWIEENITVAINYTRKIVLEALS